MEDGNASVKCDGRRVSFLESFACLFEANSEGDWCNALFDLSKQFGFERTMFAVVPRPGMALEEAFLRSSYDSRWRTIYDEHGMVHFDPTVAHCLTKTTPLVWSPGIFASTSQKQMYEEACGVGLRTGLTLPMHGPRGEVGILCFVTDGALSKSLWRDMNHHLPDIALLRDVAFETCQRHITPYVEASLPKLTPKERECLKWTAVGKTSWEIAGIFRCSEAVVNFHMSNIRRKMGLSSRRAAAVKAVRLGLISLD